MTKKQKLGVKLEEKLTTTGFGSYNKAIVAVATELEKRTVNSETLQVACLLVCGDSWMIAASDSAQDLRRLVLEQAKGFGEYARMEYNPREFLEVGDKDYKSAVCGLTWVDFEAIWETFKAIAAE